MAASHIIRIPRTDQEGAYVLGEVTPSGSKPLNVKFVATDGYAPFVIKLRHDRIGEYRVSNSPCSPEEWEAILKSILLRGEPVEDIEAGAEVKSEESLTITIRRRVQGINQRLGTLALKYKEDEEVQLFDWCGAVALEREKFQETMAAETAKATDLEVRITELRNQLDELTQAKKDREAEILEKFCDILNEKKVKIREQQRLLSTARPDPSNHTIAARVAQVSSSQEDRKPAPSRRAKRKALEDASGGGSSDSDDAFARPVNTDKMDIDTPEPAKASTESEDRQTTDNDATGSEPDDEPIPPPRAQQKKPAPKAAPVSHGTRGKDKDVALPTRHNLRNTTRKAAAPPPGSETESDDEL
ncbi:hypothetical protein B0T21DRAFT_118638 [Apiosordaria backusii]|uniref:Mitotic apparatus protein p62 n=1 Tax=Apiosordaria backusii TaxID=314023 RepID=A0AA40K0V4_9PEZI|nr:hypothetical protein B0T21DRAFT_118638 [Apiosordaria backusii]